MATSFRALVTVLAATAAIAGEPRLRPEPADLVGAAGHERCKQGPLPPLDDCGMVLVTAPPVGHDASDVLHYRLEIEAFPQTQTIAGVCTATVRSNVKGLSEHLVRLHQALKITKTSVNGRVIANPPGDTRNRTIRLDDAFGVGEEFELRIEYSGKPANVGFGSFTFDDTPDGVVIGTLSQPYNAFTWWPAKDGAYAQPGDNSDRATLETWITLPTPLVAVGAGLLEGVDLLEHGRQRFRWRTKYELPPSLVFFAGGPFVRHTAMYANDGEPFPLELYLMPGDNSAGSALEELTDMLDVYTELFGPYPFAREKYGIYYAAFFGIEHPTCSGQSFAGGSLSAHELSHQWWGDSLTSRTWLEAWLHEGFATYSTGLYYEFRFGIPGYAGLFLGNATTLEAREPLYRPNATDPYNSVIYNKGGWVLHQLRTIVGDATFFEILRAYRYTYENGSVSTEDLNAVASAVSGQDLSWFFDQWVYRIGAPRYRWGWRSETIGGQPYLFVSVRQTQNAGWGEFISPITLRLDGGLSSDRRVWNRARAQHYVLPVSSGPAQVGFDPDQNIYALERTSELWQPGPPALLSAVPAPGAFVPASAAPSKITLQFSENLSSIDGIQVNGDASGALPLTNHYVASTYRLDLNLAGPLAADRYRVSMGEGIVAQASGQTLDGELGSNSPAGLPSGDGIPGGTASYWFAVGDDGLADLDDSGQVGLEDLMIALEHYGAGENKRADGDLSGDGRVDATDLAFILAAFGHARN